MKCKQNIQKIRKKFTLIFLTAVYAINKSAAIYINDA